MSHKQTTGFTLIELLIVIFIISIVTSVAMLSISRNENKQIESLANELTQKLALAEEQAMLQPTILGLSVDQQKMRFSSFKSTDNAKNEWRPLLDNALSARDIPDNIEVTVEANGKKVSELNEAERQSPQIVISTNGDVTPFTIYIGKKGQKPRFAITGNADGGVTNKELS